MRTHFLFPILVALAALLGAAADAAPAGGAAAGPWQALTRIDADAAYALLKDNHPGAAAETGDTAFMTALESGHRLALRRAAAVTDFPGYRATLGAFADGMGDGHIFSRALYEPAMLEWPGLVAAKRGGTWIVAREDAKTAGADLLGARILSCGGVPAEAWAQDVLGFHTVASVAALEALQARRLLLDDGNPFLKRPDACTFARDGKEQTLTLNWTPIPRTTLAKDFTVPAYGEAGFGLARWRGGYWIAIQALTYKAGAVVAAAKQNQAALRAAPYVVVDLRGNGGGDDAYGRQLANILYGKARVDAVLGPDTAQGGCDETWRASPANIAADEAMAAIFARQGETSGAAGYRRAVTAMKAALAAGKQLTGPIHCEDRTAPASPEAASKMKGRVIVVTDSRCFSSCIGTMGFFHKLGAVQAGLETGADTHYGEFRKITLPSGLSSFSTLQALEPDAPPHLGPYTPRYLFGGDIADTAAVKAWVAKAVLPALTRKG